MKKKSLVSNLESKIKELEKNFIELYKKAIHFKLNQQEQNFFKADKNLALITEEIAELSGLEEYEIKERLLNEARKQIL